jgi:transcriptional repressor NrdR
MLCPFCSQKDTKVLESRVQECSVRRRRECSHCDARFTTYEKFELQLNVIKKDGRKEPFNINKIKTSFEKACHKINEDQLYSLTKKVEQKILAKKSSYIKTTEIGKLVLQELKKFDKIAYVRYTSVYKSIEDPLLLKKELNTIV